MDVEAMGSAEEPPEGLRTDEDIRNVVVPPTTGRYSYASAEPRRVLPEYLEQASDNVKLAFIDTLKAHPHLAKFAFEHYGVDTIRIATRLSKPQEKQATASLSVHFITIETPTSEIHEMYGDQSHVAMRDIALKGYTTLDEREDTGELVSTERPLYLQTPDSTGFYRVFKTDGEMCKCMVFPQVLLLDQLGRQQRLPSDAPYGKYEQYNEQTRLAISEDGEMCLKSTPFLAELLENPEVPESLAKYVKTPRAGTPRNGQRGFFYDPDHKNMVALEPIQIDRVTTNGDTRTIYGRNYTDGRRICLKQIKGSPISAPKVFSGEQGYHEQLYSAAIPHHFKTESERRNRKANEDFKEVVLVPWHYRFVPINSVCRPDQLLGDEKAIKTLFFDGLSASGAPRVTMKTAGANQVWIDGEQLSHLDALKKVALDYGVSVDSAEEALKTAHQHGHATFYAVNDRVKRAFAHRLKMAQGGGPPMAPPGAGAGAPAQGGGGAMDPNVLVQQLLQDPQLLQAVAADPEGVAAELGMDPQLLMEILSLPEIQQVLSGGAGPGGGMGPAPMPPPPPPPSPVEIAAQEVAEQLMRQNQEVQEEMARQAQNLETQIQAIQAVMERAEQLAGGGQAPPPEAGMPGPGAGPAGAAPPPGPGMPVEQPGMMESAMALQDPDMFDAAAVASLASNNDYDGTVGAFLPTLRSALDAIGRLLVEFRMKAAEMKTSIGEETYSDLRDRLESLFQSLGATLVQLGNLNSSEEPSPV